MDQAKLQLGDALELVAGRGDAGRVEAGNLDEDLVLTDGGNDRLADAELVHPRSDDLHGLLLRGGGNFASRTLTH